MATLAADNRHESRDLSVKEAAAIINVCSNFLYDRIGKDGGPPFMRRGKKIVLPRDSFLKWASQKIIP